MADDDEMHSISRMKPRFANGTTMEARAMTEQNLEKLARAMSTGPSITKVKSRLSSVKTPNTLLSKSTEKSRTITQAASASKLKHKRGFIGNWYKNTDYD